MGQNPLLFDFATAFGFAIAAETFSIAWAKVIGTQSGRRR
jgi:hypothetical protein